MTGVAGLQDAWQETQQAAGDFWGWHSQHLVKSLQDSWQHTRQSAPHLGQQLQRQLHGLHQHLQHIDLGPAIAMAVLILAAAAALRAVFRERRVRCIAQLMLSCVPVRPRNLA